MDNVTVLKLDIAKTIQELLNLINDNIENKNEEIVEEFKKKLVDLQKVMVENG